ncbi:MAG: ferredoxin--NADP reductase [FCB group bacterium]|nr:ferredoxin--NADP reductase [FCB group bacterium]
MQRELNAYISQKISVSPELIILRIIPDGWDLPDFEPGQYAVIGLPGSAPRIELCDPEEDTNPDKFILRAYSIASASVHKEYLELYIALVRSGSLTPRLFALEAGDQIHLAPKMKGVFILDKIPVRKNVVMLGTGTGLAPYMSMIRSALRPGSGRRFAVIHGARHSWDLGYRSELITLNGMMDNFSYIPIISRPDAELTPWGGITGYVQDVWEMDIIRRNWGFEPTPDNTHIFLCGNPGMIESALDVLGKHNFIEHNRKQDGQIHLEKYW